MPDYDLGTARGRIEIDASTLGRTTASMDKVGKGLLGVGALAIGGFALAVGAAAGFEKSMSGVQAVLGLTAGEMDGLREKAFELGRTSTFSSKEVVDGMESMAKAGLHASDILGGAADAAVALAQAAGGGMNLDQASEIMVNAMKTFQLGAGDLNHVADIMAGAANASTVEVDDLATSLKYAGAVAHTQGVSFDELNTALAILGDRGIKGSTAGTSLRGVLLSLTGTSGPAKEALRDLGIITADGGNEFFTAEGKMKSFAEVAQILQNRTKDLTQEQKTQTFNTIFQRRAMASALILAEQGAQGFADYSKEIGRTSAQEVAAVKLDNLAGKMKILKSSVQNLVIQFGEIFQKMLKGWAERAITLVNWLSSLDDGTKKLILQIALAIGVIATIAGTILLVTSAMVKMYRTTKDLIKGVQLVAKAFKLLSTSLLTNPVFLVIAGIIALGIALFVAYKKVKAFHDAVDKGWQMLQKFWDVVTGGAVAAWHGFQTFVDAVTGAISATVRFVKANWDLLLPILLGPVGAVILVWRRFGDEIKAVFSAVVGAVVGFFTALPGQVVGFFNTIWDTVFKFFTELPGHIISFGASALSAFRDFLSKLPYWAGYYLGLVLGTLIRWTIESVAAMVQFGVDFLKATVDFFTQLPGRIAGFLTMAYNNITGWVTRGVAAAVDFGTRFLKTVADFFTQLPGRIAGFLVDTYNRITNFEAQAIAAAVRVGSGVLNTIVNFVTQLPGRIAGFFTAAVAAISNAVTGALSAAASFATTIYNKIHDTLVALPGVVGDILGKIISAIKDKIKDAFNAVKDFASGLWNGFKKGLGIGSPSLIEYAMWDLVDNVTASTKDLGGQMREIQKLGNGLTKLDGLNPQIGVGLAQGAGAVAPASTALATNPYAQGAPGTAAQQSGDHIQIYGADQKSALQISQEIMFQKRVKVAG